jgi:hypothetical protein
LLRKESGKKADRGGGGKTDAIGGKRLTCEGAEHSRRENSGTKRCHLGQGFKGFYKRAQVFFCKREKVFLTGKK